MTAAAPGQGRRRVLITGAGGFVGSHAARALAADGWDVVALLRPGTSRAGLAGLDRTLTVVEAELENAAALDAALAAGPFTAALHLAWTVDAEVHTSIRSVPCVAFTLAVVDRLGTLGCRRQVLAGTSLEYAPASAPLRETDALAPRNLYATSKHALRMLAEALAPRHRLRLAWLRLFNLYGPFAHPWQLVPHVTRRLLAGEPCPLTDGAQVCDFLHITDAARAIAAVLASDLEGPVNIGSGRGVRVADIARHVTGLVGRPELLEYGALSRAPHQAPHHVASIERLAGLGFAPSVALADGLGDTVDWWRRQKERS